MAKLEGRKNLGEKERAETLLLKTKENLPMGISIREAT